MEVAAGARAPEPGEKQGLKPCLLRRNRGCEQYGVAASGLEDLRSKAYDILAIDKSLAPVTLVLAEDGTIVDDDDYFLCLPSNTKFVALAGNEKWAYGNSDGGTTWISQESFSVDETDNGVGPKWKNVTRQLKEDLSSIILLSEEDLQEQRSFGSQLKMSSSRSRKKRRVDTLSQDVAWLNPGPQTFRTPLPSTHRARIPTWGQMKKLSEESRRVVIESGQEVTPTSLFLAMTALITAQSGRNSQEVKD